jgi:CHAD domain-containing protein
MQCTSKKIDRSLGDSDSGGALQLVREKRCEAARSTTQRRDLPVLRPAREHTLEPAEETQAVTKTDWTEETTKTRSEAVECGLLEEDRGEKARSVNLLRQEQDSWPADPPSWKNQITKKGTRT